MDPKDVKKIRTFRINLEKVLNIEKMIVFGSRARGDHLRHSDFDVIIVSEDFEQIKFVERPAALYQYWPYDLSLELLCYTPKEFERKIKQIGTVQIAVKEGIEI